MVRQFFVFIHRWAGLAMTVFLILVGLTGSLLAFKTDVERLICPRIYATPRPGVPPLDIATLAERAQAMVPQGQVVTVGIEEPDQALVVFEPRDDPATDKPVRAWLRPDVRRPVDRRRARPAPARRPLGRPHQSHAFHLEIYTGTSRSLGSAAGKS